MMLKRFTQLALAGCLLLMAAAVATPSPQEAAGAGQEAAKKKQPKDMAEYELIDKTFKEQDPKTKIQLLTEWEEKYPESDYDEDRVRLFMRSYQAAGEREKAIDIAKKILADAPGDFESNFIIMTLTPQLGKTDAATLNTGAKAAQELLKGKPATLQEAQWNQVKQQVTTSAHTTLGWIHMQNKDNVKAEEEFKTVLGLDPGNAQISYWLGNVVLGQGDPNKNELALFSFARAASIDGPGALPAEAKASVNDYLTKVYVKFSGSEEGLDDLKAKAKAQPLPPAGLKIMSAAEREFEREKAERAANPLLYKYLDLKANLTGSSGDKIWAELQGKLTPEMALYIVGADSARPQVLNLSSKQGGETEVVLNLENRLREHPGNGRKVTVEGVASSLQKSPFKLTLTSGKLL